MNHVVIIFVPADATPREFEAAWRQHLGAEPASEPSPQAQAAPLADQDELPLWTWFTPNPRR